MASLNDFKLINTKSNKYFNLLLNHFAKDTITSRIATLPEIQKNRLGFYIFALEHLTGLTDLDELIEIITDTEFNNIFNEIYHDDFGIDAIFIDYNSQPQKSINLFNFKFRESFNSDRQQSTSEVLISQKFTNLLMSSLSDNNEELLKLGSSSKIRAFSEEIITLLRSSEAWDINLYMVSNESRTISPSDPHIKSLENFLDLSTKSIGLDNLKELLFDRPQAKKCKFVIDTDAVMSFTETPLDSSKSYIVRMKLSELIRITNKNSDLAENHSLEDISLLKNLDFDFSVLYDNVRGFVLKSKYNQNIQLTLQENEDKFFLYNNGITITTKELKAEPINGKTKLRISLNDFQVINGGQTLRSIHMFNQEQDSNIEKLNNAQILVRIFQVKDDFNTENKIAEYTNSQNAISSADLKSLREEQIHIEKILDDHEIIYARKTGDLGKDGKTYKNKISMERLGQVLLAASGFPEKSSDQKRKIFDEYYDQLFGESLDIELVPKYVKRYLEIKQFYQNSSYTLSEQKIFYIFWLDHISNKANIAIDLNFLITYFENFHDNYEGSSLVAKSRYLIQVGFREALSNQFQHDYWKEKA